MIEVRQATYEDIDGIITLFKENYQSYHYNALLSCEELSLLLKNNFIGWIALDANVVVGFSGLYELKNDNHNVIKLAHLLVDSKYRNQHIGTLLEREREKYYETIPDSTIIASCVDIPPQSLLLKKKHGFKFCGIRSNYRPKGALRGHSVLMTRHNVIDNCKCIEKPSDITQGFIKEISYVCECSRTFSLKKDYPQEQFIIEKDEAAGRYVARQEYLSKDYSNNKKVSLKEALGIIQGKENCYSAVLLNALSKGFAIQDELLTSKGYRPVVYIPNYSCDMDVVEYQLLNTYELEKLDQLLFKLKEMNIYENSTGLCAI